MKWNMNLKRQYCATKVNSQHIHDHRPPPALAPPPPVALHRIRCNEIWIGTFWMAAHWPAPVTSWVHSTLLSLDHTQHTHNTIENLLSILPRFAIESVMVRPLKIDGDWCAAAERRKTLCVKPWSTYCSLSNDKLLQRLSEWVVWSMWWRNVLFWHRWQAQKHFYLLLINKTSSSSPSHHPLHECVCVSNHRYLE